MRLSAVKKLVVEQAPVKPIIESPYLAARSAWDERYGDLIVRARNWRRAAFVAIGVTGVLGVGNAIQAYRSQFHVYMVAVDSIGRIVAQGPASEQDGNLTEAMKTQAVASWVEGLRTVTSDTVMQRRFIERTYSMIAKNSKAETYINEKFRGLSPYERAQKETVEIQINAVLPVGNAYQVEWTETVRDAVGGEVQKKTHMKGIFTVVRNRPTNETSAGANVLGLFVTDATWTLVAEEKVAQ